MNRIKRLSAALAAAALLAALSGCSQDAQNRLSRMGVSYLDGDYRVTFASGTYSKSWDILDGKITSEPDKGYYFFWTRDANGKQKYVQVPIDRAVIEEL